MSLSGSNGLGGQPGQEKSWIAAIGETDEGMSGQCDLELAVASEEELRGRMGVGEGGLYQNPGHEGQGQGPGRVSWLCLDREGFSDQCRALASGCQPWYRSLEGLRRRY